MRRFSLCTAALCLTAVPAAADVPLPSAVVAAPAPAQPPARSPRPAAKPALLGAQAATPTRDTGGVAAPLPRGNPGDPLGRDRLEADTDAGNPAAQQEQGRAAGTEAKEGAASAGESAWRDVERK